MDAHAHALALALAGAAERHGLKDSIVSMMSPCARRLLSAQASSAYPCISVHCIPAACFLSAVSEALPDT